MGKKESNPLPPAGAVKPKAPPTPPMVKTPYRGGCASTAALSALFQMKVLLVHVDDSIGDGESAG